MATVTRVECDECKAIVKESDEVKLQLYKVELPENKGFILGQPREFCGIKCLMNFLSNNTNMGVVK